MIAERAAGLGLAVFMAGIFLLVVRHGDKTGSLLAYLALGSVGRGKSPRAFGLRRTIYLVLAYLTLAVGLAAAASLLPL